MCATAEGGNGSPDPDRPHRVLLVDDDENVLQACTRVLRRRFRLDTALGGEQALEAGIREPIALLTRGNG